MQNKPTAAKALTAELRQQLEADNTFRRVFQLELEPVRGNFDAAHLKEVNRRIFQDLPGAGFGDVTPGEFRKPVPDGVDWMKQRGLSTVGGSFYVAYSRMGDAATDRLDKVLESAKPDALRGLKTSEFTARFAKIYAELDYVHPFSDGNSRTLRTFTKQLAKEAGYEVDWERFGRSDVGRDLLYIARDLIVNGLAKPYVQNESAMRKILSTQDRLEGNRALPDLLRDAVRPSRAVAFEQMTEREALKEYPELKDAYETMHTAAAYFESKMPGKPEAQEAGIQSVMDHVQSRLNAGETADFSRGREQEKQEIQTSRQRPEPGPEHDR
ncbi:cell filamentation protein Fic [Verminephrobacter aporrectodeae subsp. tuberculatae]|uniref:Fic family protein n=1 Tax=Verminephrobacter aporrectodeae TaxID=1110389 RepID=UPI0022433A50|nr:Fic family protein [Verminephrobacter aporrectodeae]MCW8200643.1 cell filamentation protein Fic [Verminephrobacter aporrectodeae subsp. tuberculatae]